MTHSIKTLLKKNALFVFALEDEAKEEFSDVRVLFTGIGKLNAAYKLTSAIKQNKPDIIINLGSAGSNSYTQGQVVCCTEFIQRDMDVTPLGFEKYETPFSDQKPILHYGLEIPGIPKGICGSGDSFDVTHNTKSYNVIDMEAYPLAWVAMQEQIPFLCLKYISDGANEAAADNWQESVHKAAKALKQVMKTLLE